MQILLIHHGFPGQFKHIIPALQLRGDVIWSIGRTRNKENIPLGVRYYAYRVGQRNGKDTFPLASEFETKIIRAAAVAKIANSLSLEGFKPDIIIGHPGWGEMLFIGDIWPNVPQIHYVEFFYGIPDTDNDIDDIYAKKQSWREKAGARVKNTHLLANMNQMQAGITPTYFQYSLIPTWAKQKTEIIHDGINTQWLQPDCKAELKIPNGPLLRKGDPVITFINRTFEPYRGIHVFLEALANLQLQHPTAQAILVGADTPNVSYGQARNDGKGWLTAISEEMGNRLDWSRIHNVGRIPHQTLRKVYQISAAHVYLSYPFVLSWSLLEAMSCAAPIVGSDTDPVREVIKNEETGLLCPFNDSKALSLCILKMLNKPSTLIDIRKNARIHIQNHYQLKDCINKQIKLIDNIAKL